MKPADFFALIRDAALAFGQDKAPRLSAAIAYYAIFSLSPILLFAVVIAGNFLTNADVINQLFGPESSISQNLGPEAAAFLKTLLPDPNSLHKSSRIATAVAFGVTFMGATGLFVQLQDALNSLWGADSKPGGGILAMIKTRFLAFLMILAIGILLLAFFVFNTYLSAIATNLGGLGAFVVRLLTFVVSVLFLTPIFAGIYKFLPDVKLEWREVWVGGVFTTALFTLGQIVISIYFGRAAPASVFGAAGSLVLFLLWMYYSAMIFFFGAEVTWVYSQKYGTHAGGAANTAKKEAVATESAKIDAQASHKKGETPAPVTPKTPRLSLPKLSLPKVNLPKLKPKAKDDLPSLGSAVWNAISAILAIPSLIVLKLARLLGF